MTDRDGGNMGWGGFEGGGEGGKTGGQASCGKSEPSESSERGGARGRGGKKNDGVTKQKLLPRRFLLGPPGRSQSEASSAGPPQRSFPPLPNLISFWLLSALSPSDQRTVDGRMIGPKPRESSNLVKSTSSSSSGGSSSSSSQQRKERKKHKKTEKRKPPLGGEALTAPIIPIHGRPACDICCVSLFALLDPCSPLLPLPHTHSLLSPGLRCLKPPKGEVAPGTAAGKPQVQAMMSWKKLGARPWKEQVEHV
ncbi:hypothetical protein CIRG_07737 [Coccidioides immitis RMSCC 2394]|uniref:Uncharacterized protein n=1 Tax=Coccidioides immitis RMSCC 2394 TaxID=404692 RepID=A0A0J6YHA8_COCIT|nr:hypothetical protein CIRG_07737 [Coccidioides immitis RMSCC 2394]